MAVDAANRPYFFPVDNGKSDVQVPDRTVWVDERPGASTTPTPTRPSLSSKYPISQKNSQASFSTSPRHGSRSTNDSHSIADTWSSRADSLTPPNSYNNEHASSSRNVLRKPKSSKNLFAMLRRSKSKPRLDADDPQPPGASTSSPPSLPSYIDQDSFHPFGSTSPSKWSKPAGKHRRKHTKTSPTSSLPTTESFDLDLNVMDGIVHPHALQQATGGSPPAPTSLEPDHPPLPETRARILPPVKSNAHEPIELFTNPFRAQSPPHRLNPRERNISPKSLPPLPLIAPAVTPPVLNPVLNITAEGPSEEDPTAWNAPDSWAVDPVEGQQEPEYSSSEESPASKPAASPEASAKKDRRSKRRTQTLAAKPAPPAEKTLWTIRVHCPGNTFHELCLELPVTVAELTPHLDQQVLGLSEEPKPGEKRHEIHKLYLKERGRERMLAATERPADIVRRRLEQAGYEAADGLEKLGGEDLSFLLKFLYKSYALGPSEDDLEFVDYDHVDLTNKSLRTIPVPLYGHAEGIISLNLSRNPMLEIPLDFIQSCTSLEELRLSNMSIKKVPQSVRHCTSLLKLDLSCNRIGDLDAGLERIPGLTSLIAQNNRMEKLPWYLPRLRSLKHLNISNNKFREFPELLCQMTHLVELDISFNMISELPEAISDMQDLEKLIMVGNRVSRFPEGCSRLSNLRVLDCRRNAITDVTIVEMLPELEVLLVNHNSVHALDLSSGPCVKEIDVSHNDITHIILVPGPIGQIPHNLTSLNISHAKLSSLDDLALAYLTSLLELNLDYNEFRFIPDSLGELSRLVSFSCSDNKLDALPSTIGKLQKLERLDVHNNNLTEIPATLWNCASLTRINMTSNLIATWHPPITTATLPPPPIASSSTLTVPEPTSSTFLVPNSERKLSSASTIGTSSSPPAPSTPSRTLPALAHSLEQLYLGENHLADDSLPFLTILRELRVLNLSFNDIQEMPSTFFKDMTQLEELYLSGNKISSLPTEGLHRMTRLQVLFLNGNRLQTLPHELGKIPSLAVLDVGSNALKYNINNWEFDWNWNFNTNLRYLNLSGNKRLEIKPDQARKGQPAESRVTIDLAAFDHLSQLRVLGLMDVTTTFAPNIPDDNEDRRVRTSLSEVNGMAYGIADNLGNKDFVSMFDLVQPIFQNRKDEAIFAMFGRAQSTPHNNLISKYLHDNFVGIFQECLSGLQKDKGETVQDALRRTFLKLNRLTHDSLFSANGNLQRKMSQASRKSSKLFSMSEATNLGASGIVLYIQGKTLYVANAGNCLAVVSRRGTAELVSEKHDPFDRTEISRIRSAEGWVSPKGLVNDEVDISRSFGFFHLLPVVNARPSIRQYELSEQDEFVIIGNSGLWDFVSYQTAVDIARSERADPMIASQKLRDFAISYGAEGSTMIMVISTASLFHNRDRQATVESLVDSDTYALARRKRKDEHIGDRNIARLDEEVPPPVGNLALVFTDIRNSTHLWETNGAMPTAMRLHHFLLRRQLRFCGGYEVKTEGDAFMVAFQNVSSAILWALNVQLQLLHEAWPKELLECEDGREIRDKEGRIIAKGLSLRMGIHCGAPVCEPDAITKRMDYLGPMVNRAARVCGCAAGGQIMLSADVVREIQARVLETGPDTDFSVYQPAHIVEAIRRLDIIVEPIGEKKLKGLEVPEMLSLVYPRALAGRRVLDGDASDDVPRENEGEGGLESIECSVDQLKELSMVCLRLEALTIGRIFRPLPPRKGSNAQQMPPPPPPPPLLPAADIRVKGQASLEKSDGNCSTPVEAASVDTPQLLCADPALLTPAIPDKPSQAEVLAILEFLMIRLELSTTSLANSSIFSTPEIVAISDALKKRRGKPLDAARLQEILELLEF